MTAVIQTMDQCVIVATKRQYPWRFLEEVTVVLEDKEEKDPGLDIRGQRTLGNL